MRSPAARKAAAAPKVKVKAGFISHRIPAIVLAGRAASPMEVWKVPRAVPLHSFETRSEA